MKASHNPSPHTPHKHTHTPPYAILWAHAPALLWLKGNYNYRIIDLCPVAGTEPPGYQMNLISPSSSSSSSGVCSPEKEQCEPGRKGWKKHIHLWGQSNISSPRRAEITCINCNGSHSSQCSLRKTNLMHTALPAKDVLLVVSVRGTS